MLCMKNRCTVDSLITHTSRWTAQGMRYQGVCVSREWAKISSKNRKKNRKKYEKIYRLYICKLKNATDDSEMYASLKNRSYDLWKKSVNRVCFIVLLSSTRIVMLKDAKSPSIFRAMGSFRPSIYLRMVDTALSTSR